MQADDNRKFENSDQFLENIIDRIGHYLPSQGPISTFVHHNTLHNFEEYDFFDAVEKASNIYSSSAYHSEQKYQSEFKRNRITQLDINKILGDQEVDNSSWLFGLSKRKFYRSLLLSSPHALIPESLRWRLVEKGHIGNFLPEISLQKKSKIINEDKNNISDLLNKNLLSFKESPISQWDLFWPKELTLFQYNQNIDRIRGNWKESDSTKLLWLFSANFALSFEHEQLGLFYNDKLEQGIIKESSLNEISQIEELINPYIIKFTSSFLDVGLAHLSVVDKEQGLLEAFFSHIYQNPLFLPRWLSEDSYFAMNRGLGALKIISEYLKNIKLNPKEWESFLLKKALLLKGWGGLIYRTQIGATGLGSKVTLADFIALRLILENSARKYISKENSGYNDDEVDKTVSNNQLESFRINTLSRFTYHIFSAFQYYGVSGSQLALQNEESCDALRKAILEFDYKKRIRTWHKAYEWNLYARAFSSIVSVNSNRVKKAFSPKCQIVCCIDDREESFRRHIEELSDDYQTFGTAGFFGVDAEFHSLYERPASYCPVNITPTHKVKVVPKQGSEEKIAGVGKLKQIYSDIDVLVEIQSRSLLRGWLLALGGVLALLPLSISTILPRFSFKLKNYLKKLFVNPLEESDIVYAESGEVDNSDGYSIEEMAFRVKTLLNSTGLIKNISPLVVILGHGSFSMNNPYRSAYDCGACGGRPGRLNPRVIALMANRKDVRSELEKEKILIPNNSHFVAAFHNTCTDEVEYFDTGSIPSEHQKLFEIIKSDIEIARKKNALERCRRFDEVKVEDVDEAISHVESRAYHIAQPRPEYGHATNALCFVGRREITKNIFFDRRAFLVSYDKTIDDDQAILKGILRAVVPVCMGINLEYFFSTIDNSIYGAGTKLPHNVTSLLGIMTGYCSDLRTGLPTQMIEIHEAVRLLFIVDLAPDRLHQAIQGDPELYKLCSNHWISLSSYDSDSNTLYYYNDKLQFEEYSEIPIPVAKVNSSLSWIIGKKQHLEFAEISKEL